MFSRFPSEIQVFWTLFQNPLLNWNICVLVLFFQFSLKLEREAFNQDHLSLCWEWGRVFSFLFFSLRVRKGFREGAIDETTERNDNVTFHFNYYIILLLEKKSARILFCYALFGCLKPWRKTSTGQAYSVHLSHHVATARVSGLGCLTLKKCHLHQTIK